MPRSYRVALAMSIVGEYHRAMWRGVNRFARTQGHWIMRWFAPQPLRVRSAILCWEPDGVIASLMETQGLIQPFLKAKIPTVAECDRDLKGRVPRVDCDNVAVGTAAAEYFLDRGYEHFAYFGQRRGFSLDRGQGFRRAVEAAGFTCSCFIPRLEHFERSPQLRRIEQQFTRWLRQQGRPLALFVSMDAFAARVEDLCREAKIRIPRDVAILSADNDPLFCETAPVPISSIRLPGERVGFEAARMLQRQMDGRPMSKDPVLLAPEGIVTRASSDMLAVRDPVVVQALECLRQHAFNRIGVADVARHAALSRRSLERRFRTALGRSVHQELLRLRVEHAKALLQETDLKLGVIAVRCGFTSPPRLSIAFRRLTGMTPLAYRRKLRLVE